jgi:hypothetical protein
MSTHIDDVLFAIGCLDTLPMGDELQHWLERYPEYEHEIIEFVTYLAELELAPEPEPPTEAEVDEVVRRTMERVRPLLDAVPWREEG